MLSLALLLSLTLGARAAELASPEQSLAELKALVEKPDTAQLSRLLERLSRDDDAQVRVEAARLLGQDPYRKREALSGLARALHSDPSDRVRRQAALSALSQDGSEPIVFISGMLKTERGDEVRLAVVSALASAPAHLKNSEATSALMSALEEDPSPQVRAAAADGLGGRGDRRSLGALTNAQKDPDDSVRRAAQRARDRLDKATQFRPTTRAAATAEDQSGAVKGRDRCNGANGWCQCVNGPMKPSPHCMTRENCEHTFENTFRGHGYTCTWDGQAL